MKDNFEQMLRKFKRKVNESGVLKEARKREYFEKPSDKRRRKHKEALRRT